MLYCQYFKTRTLFYMRKCFKDDDCLIGLTNTHLVNFPNSIKGAVYDSGESLLIFELSSQANTPL